MPPGPTAPRSLAGLLAEFRPCFTAPTFHTFIGLVVGLIAQTRRRTVCGMFTGAGLDQVWHHSRALRLFSNARWSGDALGLALADLIVTHLLPAGSPLTVAVDDTLFKRSGKKVFFLDFFGSVLVLVECVHASPPQAAERYAEVGAGISGLPVEGDEFCFCGAEADA